MTLGEDAVLAAQILFGGRSAQKEKFQSYSGYATEYNQVIVQGSSLKGKNAFNNEAPGNAEILSRAGIWGLKDGMPRRIL